MDSAQLSDFVHGKRITFDADRSSTREYARHMDSIDPLRESRNEFLIPAKADLKDPHPEAKPLEAQNDPSDPCLYLCGNSLGPQPKRTRGLLNEELSIWATRGVHGHFDHPLSRPWLSAAEACTENMAAVVGALPSEVAVMGSLTENIHMLMASFYTPDRTGKGRTKIIIEGKAFPSDHYAVESQIAWHGLNPQDHLITIFPEQGRHTLTTAQILRTIDTHASTAALLWLSGVQFYTGQAFDIKNITAYAQSKGLVVGWDFAHGAGNIPLELHEWGVDFAAWCTYKYLCSGPGSMAGIFVHDKHASPSRLRLAGWWGHDAATRFAMENVFRATPGAAGYMLSNPSILSLTALRASLEVYASTSMTAIRTKSLHLTGYMEHLLDGVPDAPWEIITPRDPQQRGAQLSLLFNAGVMLPVLRFLEERGVVVDERKPDVIRVAPLPLYNKYEEVWEFVQILKEAIEHVRKHGETQAEAVLEAELREKGPMDP